MRFILRGGAHVQKEDNKDVTYKHVKGRITIVESEVDLVKKFGPNKFAYEIDTAQYVQPEQPELATAKPDIPTPTGVAEGDAAPPASPEAASPPDDDMEEIVLEENPNKETPPIPEPPEDDEDDEEDEPESEPDSPPDDEDEDDEDEDEDEETPKVKLPAKHPKYGTKVTDKFPKAKKAAVEVYKTKAGGFLVIDPDDGKPLHKKPLRREKVNGFMKQYE
jgi:hypothetical protein